MVFIFCWYLLLAYEMHLRQMEKHQMTMGALGYFPLEKSRHLESVCCMKMNLSVTDMKRPVAVSLSCSSFPQGWDYRLIIDQTGNMFLFSEDDNLDEWRGNFSIHHGRKLGIQ